MKKVVTLSIIAVTFLMVSCGPSPCDCSEEFYYSAKYPGATDKDLISDCMEFKPLCESIKNFVIFVFIYKLYMKILRENILSLIHNHKTLGGRSNFEYALEKGQLYIRFGKMTNFLSVKDDWIKKIKLLEGISKIIGRKL